MRKHLAKNAQSTTQTLPLSGDGLLTRISQIWNLTPGNTAKLWPRVAKSEIFPSYKPDTHTIHYPDKTEEWQKQHEKIHAADNLLMPGKERKHHPNTKKLNQLKAPFAIKKLIDGIAFLHGGSPKWVQSRMKNESVASLSNPSGESISQNYRALATGLSLGNTSSAGLLLNPLFFALIPKIWVRHIDWKYFDQEVNFLYRRHGQDGIILFLVDPPKNLLLGFMKNPPITYGAIETNRWNKKMVKRGYLYENGGLTKHGIEHLRKVLPENEIMTRIEDAEKNR
ncbi:MAG TPA: hypothetical protein VJG83_02690 [archaeon]|nr:hypothetical protein [archaeon]